MSHYRITPLEKKSIRIVYEMYRKNSDDNISWFNIEEVFRWGAGFIEEDMDCNLSSDRNSSQYCSPYAGEWEGCEFEDSIAVYFEFSDDLSEEEQELIKEEYYNGNVGWLHDGEHDWQEEDSYVIVDPPYKIELCKEDGTLIKEIPPGE